MAASSHSKILILDFGAQYTQLIARRLRELNVYCEIHPFDVDDAFIRDFAPKGIILSGGPNSVTEGDTPRAPGGGVERRRAGARHLLRHAGDGRAAGRRGRERARCASSAMREVRARGHSALFRDIQDRANAEGHGLLDVWMSHGDKVTAMPAGFKLIGSSESCAIAAMADESRRFYARAVPSRGDAHEAGHGDPGALRARHLRLRQRLEHARLRRRGGRGGPRADRRRGRAAGPVRRRGFVGRRGADPSRDRRSPDLRVRRPRPAAAARGRAGDAHVRAEPRREGDPRRCERGVPGARSRACPIRRPSARSSASSSSTCSSARRRSCPT